MTFLLAHAWLDRLTSHQTVQALAVVVAVVVLGTVGTRVVDVLVRRTVSRGVAAGVMREAALKRARTLAHVLTRTLLAVLAVVAVFLLLDLAGYNVTPLVAGVGIASVALGLGAQTLVRDVIAGLFIMGENQYAHGDVVTIAGVTGRVEELSLRRTVLRGPDGAVHHVPHGEVHVTTNLTRDHGGVWLAVRVALAGDLERATEVADRVGRELAADSAWRERVLDPPRVSAVEDVSAAGITLRVRGAAAAGSQWAVSGEYLRRLAKELAAAGIGLG